MGERIAADSGLTETQSRTLKALLNLIIPADSDRAMPGAGELDFIGYIKEFASDSMAAIHREIDSLDARLTNELGAGVEELEERVLEQFVDKLRASEPYFAVNVVIQAINCYYQDDRVVTALGWEARPPFPKGFDVVRGDLSLLEPVRQRGKIYREP